MFCPFEQNYYFYFFIFELFSYIKIKNKFFLKNIFLIYF